MKSVFLSALLVLFLGLGTAPAAALPVTVFWDAPDIGFGAGLGVSQTTANNASAAGVPILQPVGAQPLSTANSPEIARSLDPSTLAITNIATLTANWSVVNDTANSLQNLYLLFLQPEPAEILLNGQSQTVTYDPSDVGLTLGANWVLFQVEVGGNTVYYPAVSLGNLATNANAPFPLFYVLDNPQVFSENFNFELGMPKWRLSFITVPIPEPASGVLVLAGLLGFAVGRRKRS